VWGSSVDREDPLATGLSASLQPAAAMLADGSDNRLQTRTRDDIRSLERFLASVERRAFRIARIALGNDDDALDAVQDAMLQLARRYAARPSAEWAPLFYRILRNRLRDMQRRHAVRRRVLAWLPGLGREADVSADPIELVPDAGPTPPEQLATAQAMATLERALATLPGRQLEAFMLRTFEGLDVAGTAFAMGCSEGSVKTHYSRAVHALREKLGGID